jgi:hypothetical protein
MSETPNLDKVRGLDFDRLDMLISERIGALKILAHNFDKLDANPIVAEAMCRDLILPAIYSLVNFLESVEIKSGT